MSISDKDYNKLSDTVYWIDPSHAKYNPEITEGSIQKINGKSYQILKTKDNSENGMQAMAVAPIKDGNVDTSNVIIAYAGTNASDDLDTLTDVQTVGLSKSKLQYTEKTYMPGNTIRAGDNYITKRISVDSQATTALAFAEEVQSEYKGAFITTTGHSLGEYLALLVAAENKWENVGFNGPDPYNNLSKQAKEWVKENPNYLTNYRNRGDAIGNNMFNGTGAEIKISLDMGVNPFKTAFHALSTWKFDEKGKLIIPNTEYNQQALQQQAERYAMTSFISELAYLDTLEKKLTTSGGGLSSNERIYLEDSRALAIVQGASSEYQAVMSSVIQLYQQSIDRMQQRWSQTLSDARSTGTELTESEIRSALESVSVNEQSMVTEPTTNYRQKINQAKNMTNEFTKLTQQIKQKVNELVQRDHELAQQLKG